MDSMYADEIIKTIPSSQEAEQAVIGGLLIDPEKLPDVLELITAADFYFSENRVIFERIEVMTESIKDINVITIAELVPESFAYIVGLAKDTPSAANVVSYSAIILNRSKERQLIAAANTITQLAYDNDKKTEDKIIEAQAALLGMESNEGEEAAQANSAIRAVVDEIELRFNNKGAPIGLQTGIKAIDEKINGLRNANLMIIAARPAMGKTTLAMNIAENNIRQGVPVLVFSAEMSRAELMERMVASSGNINFGKIRSGQLVDDDWAKLSAGISHLRDKPLYIDDRGGLHINQVKASARKMHKKHGLKLIVIDYLQLLSGDGNSREQEISSIARGLKALAKELDIPVIALSQLNRKCEERTDKRPNCSDLRDSGAIEQDADIVSFIYRDEVYNDNSEHRGIAEIIFAKARNFEIGKVYVASRLDVCRFESLSGPLPEISENRGTFNYN